MVLIAPPLCWRWSNGIDDHLRDVRRRYERCDRAKENCVRPRSRGRFVNKTCRYLSEVNAAVAECSE